MPQRPAQSIVGDINRPVAGGDIKQGFTSNRQDAIGELNTHQRASDERG
jgi:hypothetical protein